MTYTLAEVFTLDSIQFIWKQNSPSNHSNFHLKLNPQYAFDLIEKNILVKKIVTDKNHTGVQVDAFPKLLLDYFKSVTIICDLDPSDCMNKLSRVRMFIFWKDDNFVVLGKSSDFDKAL